MSLHLYSEIINIYIYTHTYIIFVLKAKFKSTVVSLFVFFIFTYRNKGSVTHVTTVKRETNIALAGG